MKIIIKKQKKPYEKWIKVLVVSGLIVVFYFVMKPEISIVENNPVTVPEVSNDVMRDKSEVFVNGFESYINDIRWLDDQTVVMKSNKGALRDCDFEVDLEELSVSAFNTEEIELPSITIKDQVITQYDLLDVCDARTLYYFNSDSIYGIYSYDGEGNYLFITDKMKLSSESLPLFKLSKNNQKMLYVEASTDRLVTYDFTTQKKKILSPVVTEETFYDNMILSPDGGYLLEILNSDIGTLNCYGADSGKLYLDNLEGVNPVFSNESDKLYYLYAGDMATEFTGKRIGVVTLSEREINYLTSDNEETFFTRILPIENNQLIYFVGIDEEDHFVMDEVVIYDPETNEKKSISALKGMQISKDCRYEVNNQMLLLPEASTQLTLLNLETQAVQNFYDLTRLSDNSLYIKNRDGFLLGYGNSIYRIDHGGKTLIYQYDGEYVTLSISPEEDKLLVVTKDDQNLNCVISFKLGVNY